MQTKYFSWMHDCLREGLLYKSLGKGKVRCGVCERRCLIAEGGVGYCGTRVNLGGVLYTLNYGNLSALESRPIEIKPFFHFWPGSTAMTFSTWGCNFPCPWCQNWHLSKVSPPSAGAVQPERVVEEAVNAGDEGVCASFNEPLMGFEYTLDVFRLTRAKELYSTYVSNGYMTPEALGMLIDAGLDGLKVDVKGDAEVYREMFGARVDVVWRNVEQALRMGVHVEVVFLMVTGVSDSEDIIEDVVENHLKHAGPDVPLHISRYFPAYRYFEPPTRLEKLDYAWNLARRMGVNFVYVGNVPGHPGLHTYCPRCGRPVLKRSNFRLVRSNLDEKGRCKFCGEKIPIRGRLLRKNIAL